MLKSCEGVEFMAYHAFDGGKAEAFGNKNSGNDGWVPSESQTMQAKNDFLQRGIRVF